MNGDDDVLVLIVSTIKTFIRILLAMFGSLSDEIATFIAALIEFVLGRSRICACVVDAFRSQLRSVYRTHIYLAESGGKPVCRLSKNHNYTGEVIRLFPKLVT